MFHTHIEFAHWDIAFVEGRDEMWFFRRSRFMQQVAISWGNLSFRPPTVIAGTLQTNLGLPFPRDQTLVHCFAYQRDKRQENRQDYWWRWRWWGWCRWWWWWWCWHGRSKYKQLNVLSIVNVGVWVQFNFLSLFLLLPSAFFNHPIERQIVLHAQLRLSARMLINIGVSLVFSITIAFVFSVLISRPNHRILVSSICLMLFLLLPSHRYSAPPRAWWGLANLMKRNRPNGLLRKLTPSCFLPLDFPSSEEHCSRADNDIALFLPSPIVSPSHPSGPPPSDKATPYNMRSGPHDFIPYLECQENFCYRILFLFFSVEYYFCNLLCVCW